MRTTPPPPARDRMPGAYCGPRCPFCRARPGPECPDTARSTRALRRQEHRALEAYLREELGTAPRVSFLDESDCVHGCAGGRYGCSDRCTFICHPEPVEMRT